MNTLLDELSTSLVDGDLEHQVRALIKLLHHSTGLESAYFTRIDLAEGVQQVVYALNTGNLKLDEGLTVPWGDTLCKRAIEQNQFVTSDVSTCWGDSDAARLLGIQTYMSAPVHLTDGNLFGTVCAASTFPQKVSAENRTLLELISQIIAIQVDREFLLQQLRIENRQFRNIALMDPLTGVGNRRALEQEIWQTLNALENKTAAYFAAFIDLDNFKHINDTHGHDAGDRFLLAICQRLKSGCDESDFIARIGGDEFVIFGKVPSKMSDEAAQQIQQKLFESTVGNIDISTTIIDYQGASVGVTISQPSDDADSLLQRADSEMYKVKKRRKKLSLS
ncbi:diguanylate cyclase domain-containing protein [Pseudoalteromonas fenneropenaei]|uniref:diguanylate cyclase n=1 Tax=Pseudoalteromonas fenneropenaei TaxID=1737459 RepID=A0ABV7CI20_9GAMM